MLRNDRANDLVQDALFQLFPADLLVMLGGKNDRIHGHGLAVFIFHRHLTLSIGAQPWECSILAHLGQAAGQLVRQRDGQWHQLRGLIAGIAEHHALIARAVGRLALPAPGF